MSTEDNPMSACGTKRPLGMCARFELRVCFRLKADTQIDAFECPLLPQRDSFPAKIVS